MTYDDETLMAYADGELDEVQRAAIARAVQTDPELARRVKQHVALRARLAEAYAPVLQEPVPERLLTAALETSVAEVLQFPARAASAPVRQWRTAQWAAMAASLVLGVLLLWQLLAPADGLMVASNGALVARGALASALDRQRASTQGETAQVQVGITFRARDGHYCRSFTLRAAATAGLACRVDEEWNIAVTASAPASGDVRQATSPPPAVLQAIESRISGEPLDAVGEEAALRDGWD